MPKGVREPLAVRFWRAVKKSDDPEGCWLWTACRQSFQGKTKRPGYGKIGDGSSSRYAHRVSWELHYGPIPEGKDVLHDCDNPGCVRPDHLFLGDQPANMRDAWKKGRLTDLAALVRERRAS